MLRNLSRHMRQNAVAWLALFVALGGTGAYAANTIGSTDIIDGQVKSVDVGDNEIGSSDVKDNSLNTFDVHSFLGADVVDETLTGADVDDGSLQDVDVGRSTYRDFDVHVGVVGAQSCKELEVDAINTLFDHVLLTTDYGSSRPELMYEADPEFSGPTPNSVWIRVCNPTGLDINGGTTSFNLLVFKAG